MFTRLKVSLLSMVRKTMPKGLLPLVGAALFCASAQAEPITLRFTCHEGNEALKVLSNLAKQFEASHPGIRIKLENNADYGSYGQKLLAEFAADDAPDVAALGNEDFVQFARRDALLPLDDFVAQTPGFDLSAYYPQIVKAQRYRGKLYVLPRDIAPKGILYYNKRLFDEARIPYPDGSWTWDYQARPELKEKDFLWVMQRLTKFGPNGKPTQWGFTSGWPELFPTTLAVSSGARYVDDYENPTRVLFSEPKMVQAFELASDLMNHKHWMPNNVDITSVLQTNSRALFEQQKVAMFMSGIWEVPELRKSLKPGTSGFFEWDIARFPAFRDGNLVLTSGGSGYAIMASSRHPKESWELLQYFAGPPGMKALAEAGLSQPAIRAIARSDVWIPGPNTPASMRYPANRIVTDQEVDAVQFEPTSDLWTGIHNILNSKVEAIYAGTAEPATALREGTELAQNRLDVLRKDEKLPLFRWPIGAVVGVLIAIGILVWVYSAGRKDKLSARQKREQRAAMKFLAPWFIGLAFFTVGPMILSFLMSFSDWDIIRPAKWRGAGNYIEALTTDPRFFVSLKVTMVYSLVAVPLGLLGALGLALLLNQRVKGMPIYRTLFYLPTLASMMAASLIWQRIFQPEGGILNNVIYGSDGNGNFLGLASFLGHYAKPGEPINWLGNEHTALSSLIIMSLWGIGGGMIILLAGLQGVPEFYYEAAVLDGANAWQRFKAVTWPLITPSVFFTLITGIIGSLQVFTQAFVMTNGGPNDATRFYMLHLYDQAFQSLRMGYASALAWVLFLIILVLTMIQFRMSRWVYYEGSTS
jgi:ABC-type sugar transport system permease subunit/ABC-type glycerol-3-phosphate transport system substrate-binding protein